MARERTRSEGESARVRSGLLGTLPYQKRAMSVSSQTEILPREAYTSVRGRTAAPAEKGG